MSKAVTLFTITDKLNISFGLDGLGAFFLCLVTAMWILVGIYALKYKEHQKNNIRFFCFYGLTYIFLAALTMAANFMTMYMCFEFMTLLSMPMVLHNGTEESTSAAKTYLFYSVFGATLGLAGFFVVNTYGTTLDFVPGGVMDPAKMAGKETVILAVAFLSVAGFGAKAGLYPLHSWLPIAHPVAPAPASAVLSGVITKAGVLCIIRLIYFIYGVDFLRGTWVQRVWIMMALVTVFMGSMMAYGEDVIKKRFAYSTVSQVSYILFGVFTMNSIALTGALLHVVYHSVIKNGLFMCAGCIIFCTHKERVSELRGFGKAMPATFGSLAIFSLGLVGIPPFAGFMSKWYLAQGSLAEGLQTLDWAGPAVLLLSALLTAGYLFPIVINGFFPGAGFELKGFGDQWKVKSFEKKHAGPKMLGPIMLLALAVIALGILAEPLINAAQGLAESLF